MGNTDQIDEIEVFSGMLRMFWHYVWAQAFHKAGPDIEKTLDPVLVIYTRDNKFV